MEDLAGKVVALSADWNCRSGYQRRRPRSSNRRRSSSRDSSAGRSPPSDDTNSTWYWYHQSFRHWAQRCSQPCTFSPQEQLERQTSAAGHVCATKSGRLFITDKVSKCRFLIDTGSDLCVFPRKLFPQRRTRVNYDLCAANRTTISTFGWLPLRLNLGLCRDFGSLASNSSVAEEHLTAFSPSFRTALVPQECSV
jgi:hypothetical protein